MHFEKYSGGGNQASTYNRAVELYENAQKSGADRSTLESLERSVSSALGALNDSLRAAKQREHR